MIIADAGIFIGRFHPLLVHLPIGFLLLAFILAFFGQWENYKFLRPAVSFSLLSGLIFSILACITGFLLSRSGDYNEDVLTNHMWGGFGTAAISLFAYLLSSGIISSKFLLAGKTLAFTLVMMVIVVSVTGHYGGTLTHGPGYISSDLLFGKQKEKKLFTDINDAIIYDDLVGPILQKKCSNCHNNSKKKGELSLDTYQLIMKGGKHGTVVEAGHPEKSELIRRVSLDPADEKYMPADGKPSLTEDEKNIITWWVDKANASATKKVKETMASAPVKNEIAAYLGLQKNDVGDDGSADISNNHLANLNIPDINEKQLVALRQAGFIIKFINLKPLILDVTLPGNKNASQDSIDMKLKQLLTVKANILWLNVAGNNISDKQLDDIGQCKNLQRLRLDNNPVTDAGVGKLVGLDALESINLYNTKVTDQGVVSLSKLAKLKHLYVWGTGVLKSDSSGRIVNGAR